MEKVRDYIARMKMFYSTFLKYVESENNSPEDFQEFISFISSNQYDVNSDEFRSLLHIISKVSNHHKQTPIFRDKILRILNHYIEKIKQTFSNSEIFQFFRNNKFILAFLFDEKIIVADEQIANYIYSAFGVRNSALFYPEIKPFLNEKSINFIMNLLDSSEINDPEFIHKRQEGQNDSHICKLIREDSIDEFKNYLKEEDIDSCDDVPDSIFESNNFLANNETSLVEYAAFFKANKIFEFLKEEELFLGNLWPMQ